MLRIGPLALEAWHILALVAALVALIWTIQGFMVRISGTWERVDEDNRQSETLYFAQFGPFVRGRRIMRGGFQEYTGVLRGRTMIMTRRDHGKSMLEGLRFAPEVIPLIEGTVTAKLRLTLSADGRALFGTFVPQKIEYTRKPPKITRRVFMDPQFRRYQLRSRAVEPATTSEPRRAGAK